MRTRTHTLSLLGSVALVLSSATSTPGLISCADYSIVPRYAGVVDTPGTAVDVAVSGTWAYVADSSNQLQIVDVSSPEAPVVGAAPGSPAPRGGFP